MALPWLSKVLGTLESWALAVAHYVSQRTWGDLVWEFVLVSVFFGSFALAAVALNLPYQYNPYRVELIQEESFSDEDKKNPESGYGYFSKHLNTERTLRFETTVTVLVLGDIGRSPRMQYHAASIARHGNKVTLVGYVESEILPELRASRFVQIVPLKPIPKSLRTSSKLTFPFVAALKVLHQMWHVWKTCGYRTKGTKWMLVQNPPSIPTLLIAQIVCFFRNTNLIVDWHNFGYTVLALKLGENHPLVHISKLYERFIARGATAHFCVTDAMARVLKKEYGVDAMTLHDRPAKQFQPLSPAERSAVLHRLDGTKSHAKKIELKHYRLVVSSTSWTADEDFSILLDALVAYSATVSMNKRYPKILAIITGKGPMKDYYVDKIEKLRKAKRLANVVIWTAWLTPDDYAALLGAADVGISLHKSTSGVDLPMKVVDMFGTGLPVFGYSKFESWSELVKDGVNGMGFEDADELELLLETAFGGNGDKLQKLRDGALKETEHRWDDEWYPVAGKLFKLNLSPTSRVILPNTPEAAAAEKEPVKEPVTEPASVEEKATISIPEKTPGSTSAEVASKSAVARSAGAPSIASANQEGNTTTTRSQPISESSNEEKSRGLDESWQSVEVPDALEDDDKKPVTGGTFLNYDSMKQ